jgi:chemotaxis signal transduction protein
MRVVPPDTLLLPMARSESRFETRGEPAIERQGYRVGPLALVTRFDHACELVEMLPATRVPHAPEWMIGLVNLHGYPVPAFDLAPLAQVRHSSAVPRMLLVFGQGDTLAALAIDGVPQRLRFTKAACVMSPDVPPLFAGYVGTAYRLPANVAGKRMNGAAASKDKPSEIDWLELDVTRLFEDLASTVAEREGQSP